MADSHAPLALTALPAGSGGTVTGLSGGAGFASRLAGMGLTVGAVLQVLHNTGQGPVLVRVRETRLALDGPLNAQLLFEDLLVGIAEALAGRMPDRLETGR